MRVLFLISAFACAALATAADDKDKSLRDSVDKQQSLRDLGVKQQSLRDLLGGGSAVQEEPLPPERAFVMDTKALGADAVGVTFTPAPTYYLYRNKFAFAVAQPGEVSVKDVQLPSGEMKDDPIFGRTEVYHNRVQALVSLQAAKALPRELELNVTMQGCTERGLCYPPDTRRVKVVLAAADLASATATDATPAAQVAQSPTNGGTPGRVTWATLILLAAGAGALALWYARRRRG